MVLGGTGHIGAAIARAFVHAGHNVTVSGRRQIARPNLADIDVTQIHGDDHDPETVSGWIAGRDLVVDAATPYPLWIYDRQHADIIAQARKRTQHILNEVRVQEAAFVHVSSFTTLPHRRGILGQVRQGFSQGLHSYFDLKRAVEMDVLEALVAGLRGCVLNPATCFGPYDLKPKAQTFIPMLLSGSVNGLVRTPLNAVDVRDVGAVALAACRCGFPDRQVPVFGHNADLIALAGQICAMRGVRPPALRVPSALGLAALYWTETAFAATGRQSPWPSLPMMLLDASYEAQPSAAQLRLLPHLRPLEETLEDAIRWYESMGYL